MSDAIGAALIAAVSSVVGSVLTFIVGIRQIRRSVSTSTRSGVFVVCGQNSRRGGTYDHWGCPEGCPEASACGPPPLVPLTYTTSSPR